MSLTSQPRSPCPPEQVWDELAAGLLHGEEAMDLAEHASWCPKCAAALRSSVEIFASDTEKEALPAVSRGPGPVEIRRRHRPRNRYLWAAISAAAMVLAVFGIAIYQRWSKPTDPLALLARVYSSHRTLEPRLPGAAYGPIRIDRGTAPGSLADQPGDLLEAAARIGRELARNSNDPLWLWAKGRLAVLENRPDEAIAALEAAMDWGPATPDMLTDLAVAYWEKGKRDNAATDLNHAIELLGRALKANPNHPAALFDRALIEMELHETAPAIADLEKLLSVEPRGPWSDETRALLELLRRQRAQFLDRTPGQDAIRFDEIALENALAGGLAGPANDLKLLAARLRDTHRDVWLSDLLQAPKTPANAAAVGVLARMASIRLTVESGRYRKEKAAFDTLLRTQLPAPLAAWRDLEALYRATRSGGEFRCPISSGEPSAKLAASAYHWLASQVLLEQGTCSAQGGDIDAAERYARGSIGGAAQHDFPVAATRATALLVNVVRRRGQYRKAINLANSALEAIVARQLPIARSHEFYNIMMGASEDLGWWHSAQSAAAAMTEAARDAGFRDLQFTNTIRWAQLALRCGDQAQSRELFAQAMAYYAVLAPSENRAWAEIGFAEATRDGSRLAQFGGELEESRNSAAWIPYQRVRAELALEKGGTAEARERLERIVTWMNSPEASLPTRSNQWHAEFRAAGQVYLDLMLRQEHFREAFDLLQQWRAAEERALSNVRNRARTPADGALAFAFVPVRERLAAWRVDGTTVDFRWVPVSRPQVERMVRGFRRLLSSPESSPEAIYALGAELRSALFGTWLDSVAADRALVIQTDDSLANLAFVALPVAGQPLGFAHPISVTPLELKGSALPAQPFRLGGNILVIDASEPGSAWGKELPALTGAEREIEGIQRSSAGKMEVIRGEKATTVLIARRASSARILHFVGHAVGTQMGAGLVLPHLITPEGLQDLWQGGLSAPPTVVLSACSTGDVMETDSFGPGSLATAFLLEGSGEVIASLWNVDSESTAELMAEYYRGLGLGSGSGNALRSAMLAVHRSDRYSHPYFWASFARFVRV